MGEDVGCVVQIARRGPPPSRNRFLGSVLPRSGYRRGWDPGWVEAPVMDATTVEIDGWYDLLRLPVDLPKLLRNLSSPLSRPLWSRTRNNKRKPQSSLVWVA